MKKVIVLSVRPQWLVKIINGEKTIEIRKSIPKNIELPCEVYLLCSKAEPYLTKIYGEYLLTKYTCDKSPDGNVEMMNGKIVAKFTLNKMNRIWQRQMLYDDFEHFYSTDDERISEKACMTDDDIEKYFGGYNKNGYAWHIDDLVIFDKPMELREFYQIDVYRNEFEEQFKRINKSPQSWCYAYIEE